MLILITFPFPLTIIISHGRHRQSGIGTDGGKSISKLMTCRSTANNRHPKFFRMNCVQKKTLGEPSTVINEDGLNNALEFTKNVSGESSQIAKPAAKYVMAARDDGLVREEKSNRVVSREDKTELTEIEDVKHFGDFSDAVSHPF